MLCRSCQAPDLKSIIPLGNLPLANGLLKGPSFEGEVSYNLEVMLCASCGLAQLKDLVDPALLFSDYVYFSSYSDTMLASAKALVDRLAPTLSPESFVIEVASNDGYLLKNYIDHHIPVLGIDPAQNIAQVANARGIPTLCEFFGESLAQKLSQEGKKVDLLHANNVMAHVPDINGFIAGLKLLLKPSGMAVIEVPYLLDLVTHHEFDTIYHEHVYYFALHPLRAAFKRHGLELFDIEKLSLHGGTVRLFVGHDGAHAVHPIVNDMLDAEKISGILLPETYESFMAYLKALKGDLHSLLHRLKGENKKIAAYGASAKGATLLNFFEVGSKDLTFVVDRSAAKQGLYTPGTHLPIRPPEALLEEKIDYALLLTWNFAPEIMEQQKAFREQGGQFILPLPEVTLAA